MENLADRIGGLCAALAENGLAPAAAHAGARHLLAQILAEARTDDPPGTLSEHLDLLRTALASVGADDLLSTARRYSPLPGVRPLEVGWVCPLRRRCSRVATKPGHDREAPDCGVAGTPMAAVRIKT